MSYQINYISFMIEFEIQPQREMKFFDIIDAVITRLKKLSS